MDAGRADELFAEGVKRHLAGDFGGAEVYYSQVVAIRPNHADALHNLGILAYQAGRQALARTRVEQAIQFAPHVYAYHGTLGAVLKAAGDLERAAVSFKRAIELEPNAPEVHNNLGVTLKALQRPSEALESYSRAIALNPLYADAHLNLGNAFLGLRRFEEAAAAYRRAAELLPGYAEAYSGLGAALKALGQLEQAAASCRVAIDLKPELQVAHLNLGAALQAGGAYDEATSTYQKAIELRPDDAEARALLASAFQDSGQFTSAVKAYDEALARKPAWPEASNNLAAVLIPLGRFDEAIAAAQTAITCRPDFVAAYATRGTAEAMSGRLAEAEISFLQALALSPSYAPALSNRLFCLNYAPDLTAEEVFDAYASCEAVLGPYSPPIPSSVKSAEPLRVGYISPDFRQHPCRHFVEPLFERHDRRHFQVHAYSEGASEDWMTKRYRSLADSFTVTDQLDDEALAKKIREDQIDILVDLGGHTNGNRLGVFALRPAPKSAAWLGTGYTTGMAVIDYFITDQSMAPPGSDHLFAEQPLRLPIGYVYRPSPSMGLQGPLPALLKGHMTFGALTRAIRINYRTVRAWSELLKRVEGSRLVVNSRDFQHGSMQAHLAARFAEQGIGPDRLEIGFETPPWDVLRQIDIGLDCFPHNSGTTLFESLYMGVPVVTLAGRPSVGLIGNSILTGLGRPEWIASDEDQYVEIAARLASDLPALAEIRRNLRAEMQASPLMDEEGFVRELEAAYRRMIERAVSAD